MKGKLTDRENAPVKRGKSEAKYEKICGIEAEGNPQI